MDAGDADELLAAAAAAMPRAVRLSQLRRALLATSSVLAALADGTGARQLKKEIDGLIVQLTARRQYMRGSEEGLSFDPRFLAFEFLTGMLLRESQCQLISDFVTRATVGGVNKHGHPTNSLVHQVIS